MRQEPGSQLGNDLFRVARTQLRTDVFRLNFGGEVKSE